MQWLSLSCLHVLKASDSRLILMTHGVYVNLAHYGKAVYLILVVLYYILAKSLHTYSVIQPPRET
ncbi:hypothetical protein C1752_00301 [Acaryochloris thomasi RCC1774]|uniref:Uncharacterized protein n=1 Tax=Acaryochloris thomasi RCC1774 TaxID=1764569 RepID=A0A2W1JQK2_9CYAN|nr:hypothetical protein C1752_00301 [Acaryochloris thomasi RCC1774]